MSLKAELETWAAALKAYDAQEFEKALELFSQIADSSKILTNMGLIYATIGEHEAAVEQFVAATQLDQFLAVAYFQCGVSNFLLQRYELALRDFDGALLYLRGNQSINYEQLGLKFKLYSAEVLFNKGLTQIYLGDVQTGLAQLDEARNEKMTDEHAVIDEAIADGGNGYTVFSIPVGVLYRPSESKLKNAKAKDYLGKAKLVATADESEAYTTFTGVTRLKQGVSPAGARLDGSAPLALNRSATVTVTSRPTVPDVDRPQPTLQRAKTTITVPANSRECIRGLNTDTPPLPRASVSNPSSPIRGRDENENPNSFANGGPVATIGRTTGRDTRMAQTTRSLSVRRPGGPTPAPLNSDNITGVGSGVPSATRASPRGSPSAREKETTRMTDFYDDYIDSYRNEEPPLPRNTQRSPDRVDRTANWARNNNASPIPPANHQHARSNGAPPSSYGLSSSGTLRRKGTKRTNRAPTRNTYYEEEEGYASGDYEEGSYEMTKIRVKLHYQDDIRGMAIDAQMPFEEFIDRICTKFGRSFDGLGLKFKDEDGGKVTLRDEMDYELAIETAKESSKGKPEGRLEVWCTDV